MNWKVSFEVFAQIWASKQGWGTLSDLHRRMCWWIQDGTEVHQKRLLMAYRHSGKSYLSQLYPAWRLYHDPNYTCLIISATQKLARRNATQIKRVLETHPLTTHLVPKNRYEEDLWQRDTFIVKRDKQLSSPSVTIQSITGQLTGNHCDEVICDDIETMDNSLSEEGQEQVWQAYNELPFIAKHHFFIGTPHHEDTIYNHLEEIGYHTIKLPARKDDGSPQDPGNFTDGNFHNEEWLSSLEATMYKGKWLSQMMLVPVPSFESKFDADLLITFRDELRQALGHEFDWSEQDRTQFLIGSKRIISVQAFWDPAGGGKGQDSSVLAVVAKDTENNVYVLDSITLSPVDKSENGERYNLAMREILDACKRYYVNKVWVETNYAKTLGVELRTFAKERNVSVAVKDHDERSNKKLRIVDTLEPLSRVGRLYVHDRVFQTDFYKQFKTFPHCKHDDHIDAVTGAIIKLSPSRVDQSGVKPQHERVPGGGVRIVQVNA